MNRFTYTRVGAYWIPELKLTEQSLHPIGKCGRMRRRYLFEGIPTHDVQSHHPDRAAPSAPGQE